MLEVWSVFACRKCQDLEKMFVWVMGRKLKCKNCGLEIEMPEMVSIELPIQDDFYPEDN